MRECGLVLTKHEIQSLLQWMQKYLNNIVEFNPVPTMGTMKEMDPHEF